MPNDTPANEGGAATSFTVSPALPAGLSLNASTGVISGTPTAITAMASYTVTASNSGGSATTSLTVTVNDAAPTALAYASNPATYTLGVAIPSNVPSHGGGAVNSYAVSPALPAGLSLDTSTGVISGTPTAITAMASYTVTASNSGGSATTSLSLTVNDAAPTALAYASNPATYTLGVAIPSNTPSHGGGAVNSYAVSPALPAGLSLDTSTGVISGTPTAITAMASYTVTASNLSGGTTVHLSIAVNDKAPVSLRYTYNSMAFLLGSSIPTDTPSNFGGAVLSYTVSPAFPSGISLDPNTGIITGIPTTITPPDTYTVTASNSGGSSTTYLFFRVIPPGPSITTQPANQTVPAGQSATFGVVGTGTGTLTYQWSLNGYPIAEATASTYTTPPVALEDTGAVYSVVLQDPYGSQVGSGNATLTVTPATTHFTYTGNIQTPRTSHTATLLPNGTVLIAGGQGYSGILTNSEIYDPSTGTFTTTGSMNSARTNHTATLLPSGKVLVTGGADVNGMATNSCEVYDPALETWSPTANLSTARLLHTATLLPNGTVLVAGGIGASGSLTSAEIYDPATGQFTATGNMNYSCEFFTATLLQNGKVLILEASSGGDVIHAELYDPSVGTFSVTGDPAVPRSFFTATLLQNGKVLLAGGGPNELSLRSCELYDPTTGTFSTTGALSFGRNMHSAALLPDGKVLLAGGQNAHGIIGSAELYDPATGICTPTSSLNNARELHTATVLPSGKLLFAGGSGQGGWLHTAELYQ